MIAALAWVPLLAAAAPLVADEQPVFARPEPHLRQGHAHLSNNEPDLALDAFRRASPNTPDQRAIVEYDVGQALVLQAQAAAKAAPEADGGPPQIDVDDARAAFDRAYGLATAPGLKSEAALASGNAAALGGKIDDAIAQFRKAVLADHTNTRAKTNLRRALDAKRAQPPQEDQQGGEDGENDEDKKDEEKKEEDKKDGEKKDGKDGEKGEEKKEEDKKDGQKKDEEKKDEEKKDEKKDGEKGEEKKDDKKDQPPQGQQQPTPKEQKKEQARRLLDALRSREKPLSPLEMRGTSKERPREGKDW